MSDVLLVTLEFTRADEPEDPHAVAGGTQDYLLRAEGGAYRATRLKWGTSFQEALVKLRQPDRDPVLVQWVGEQLRQFVAPAAWQGRAAEITDALAAGRRVVLTIRSAAAELYVLPWELLSVQASGQHLGELDNLLICYEWPGTHTVEPYSQAEGGRVIFAWSAATGRVPAAQHQRAIHDACVAGHLPFHVERDVVAHVSLNRLSAALEAAGDNVVLHVLCHGARRGETFGLAFDADDGTGTDVVDAGRLRRTLAPFASRLRLVVLCACDSGNLGQMGNPLGSVVQTLHRAGLPAVVASRFPLSVSGSIVLTESLYAALIGGPTSVETALLTARRRLITELETLDWAGVQLYARLVDGVDTRPIVFRPFRGLLAFQPPHSRFFFGRDAERAETLEDLESLRVSGKPRFLVVAGASGTGKSSMVLAGAIPDLLGTAEAGERRDEAQRIERIVRELRQLLPTYDPPAVRQSLELLSGLADDAWSSVSGWRYAAIRPGSDPLGALEPVLAGIDRPQDPFLLVVDQFEEVFTQTAEHAVREEFVQKLWSLARLPESGMHVILTVRVDFLGQCGELVLDESGVRLDRVAYDENFRVFVAQMAPHQLRAAIEEPARRVGLELEAGLVERMLSDVEGEPGALPLLSYTLDLLWKHREGRVLTQAAYETLGGVAGALYGRADAIVDALDPEQRRQARRLLVRLVAVQDGAWDTRRRVRINELRPTRSDELLAFEAVLDTLVDARLLFCTAEDDHATVELAHEALIRRWGRLRSWIIEDQEMLAQVHTVERWVGQWQAFGALLLGDQLGFASQVRDLYGDDLTEDALALIVESEIAESSTGARRRRWALFGIGAAVVVTLTMAALGSWGLVAKGDADDAADEAQLSATEALRARTTAERQEARARSAGVLSTAQGLLESEPLVASLLLLELEGPNGRHLDLPGSTFWSDEAPATAPRPEALDLALRLARTPVPERVLDRGVEGIHRAGHEELTVAMAGTGHGLAFANGATRHWDPRGRLLRERFRCFDERAQAARLDASGTRVAVAVPAGLCIFAGVGPPLELPYGGERLDRPDHLFYAGPNVIAAWELTGRLLVWRPGQADPRFEHIFRGGISRVAVSPSGDAISVLDSEERGWLTRPGDPRVRQLPLGDQALGLFRLKFSVDGQEILGLGGEQGFRWDLEGALLERFEDADDVAVWRDRVAWLQGGRLYVRKDGEVSDFEDRADYLTALPGDSWRCITRRDDGEVRAYGQTGLLRVQPPCSLDVQVLRLDPRGRWVFMAGSDGACLLPIGPGDRRIDLPTRGTTRIADAHFQADGSALITIHTDGYTAVWTAAAAEPTPLGLASGALRFDAHGTLLAASEDGTLERWQIDDAGPRALPTVERVLAISRDGSRGILADGPDARLALFGVDTPGVALEGANAPGLQLSPGGRFVFRREERGVRVWDTALGGQGSLIIDPHPVTGIFIDPTDRFLATINRTRAGGSAWLRPLPLVPGAPALRLGPPGVHGLDFSPDGRRVVVAVADGPRQAVRLIPTAEPERGEDLPLTTKEALGRPRFSPDGTWILAETESAPLLWWVEDRSAHALISRVHLERELLSARFSPDRENIILIWGTGTAQRWLLTDLEKQIRIRGHRGGLLEASFSPDGSRFAIHDQRGAVRWWTMGEDDHAVLVDDGRLAVEDVLFSRDNKWLVTRSGENEVWLWTLEWARLLQTLRRRTSACLSADERQRFLQDRPATAESLATECHTRYGVDR